MVDRIELITRVPEEDEDASLPRLRSSVVPTRLNDYQVRSRDVVCNVAHVAGRDVRSKIPDLAIGRDESLRWSAPERAAPPVDVYRARGASRRRARRWCKARACDHEVIRSVAVEVCFG